MFPSLHPFRGSIMRRLTAQAVALTGLSVLVLALLSVFVARSLARQSALSEAATLSAVAEETVEKSLRYVRGRTVLLAGHGDIAALAAGADAGVWPLLTADSDDSLPVIGFALFSPSGDMLAGEGREIAFVDDGVRTTVRPSVTSSGLTVYDVRTPVRRDGSVIAILALRYDASAVMGRLASLSLALGKTGEAMVSFRRDLRPYVFRPSTDARRFSLLPLSPASDTPTLRSLLGGEGVAETADDEGRAVFAAYRYLPDVGWGISLTVSRAEVFGETAFLARLIGFIGACLLLLAGIAAAVLSRTITLPLRSLAGKVTGLRPGTAVERSIRTGDEVEVLDEVVADMSSRLKKVYDDMDGVIVERTKELAEEYARDSAVLESIEYAVIAVDADGAVTRANTAAKQVLGRDPADMKGKKIADVVLLRAHHGNPIEGEHPVLRALRTDATVRSTAAAHWSVQRPDQSLTPVSCVVTPLRENGRVFGAILVLQDVSEERRLDYLKSEFITLASHQLRTPLSALRWYVELMEEDGDAPLSDDRKGYVKEMGVSLKRMSNLLDSLLRASQMEEDGLALALAETDLNQLISETDEDFRSIAQERGISFSASLPEAPVRAKTDPTLLRIVLQNLLSNATKYTAKGSHIALSLDADASSFSLSVADEGMGIPEAEQKRVFQKFFRARNVRQMDTDGNGLGLYITKSIVERLGGTISFKSAEGKGTTFTVTFPRSR